MDLPLDNKTVWASGPPGRRAAGPSRAVGRGQLGLRAAGPLGRGPAFSKTPEKNMASKSIPLLKYQTTNTLVSGFVRPSYLEQQKNKAKLQNTRPRLRDMELA